MDDAVLHWRYSYQLLNSPKRCCYWRFRYRCVGLLERVLRALSTIRAKNSATGERSDQTL